MSENQFNENHEGYIPTKSIKVLRNGDSYYRGKKIVVNQKKMRNWNVLLDELSDTLEAKFGAVRRLYTPINGTRVRHITDLEDKKIYIAAGNEKFRKLNYLDIDSGKLVNDNNLLRPVNYQEYWNSSGSKAVQFTPSNIVLYVHKNGDPLFVPARILLRQRVIDQGMLHVLDEINEKLRLRGAVRKLYTTEGDPIRNVSQLEHNAYYVAVGKGDRFRQFSYSSQQNSQRGSSPKNKSQNGSAPFSDNNSRKSVQRYNDGESIEIEERSDYTIGSSNATPQYPSSHGSLRKQNHTQDSTRRNSEKRKEDPNEKIFKGKNSHESNGKKKRAVDKNDGVFSGAKQKDSKAKEIDESEDLKRKEKERNKPAEELEDKGKSDDHNEKRLSGRSETEKKRPDSMNQYKVLPPISSPTQKEDDAAKVIQRNYRKYKKN
ncbi:hypothetical protein SNEBB_005354 [Seison nebaliae]|nr:hypothetical protein SNEBB_005354 [Seison nebaliae]